MAKYLIDRPAYVNGLYVFAELGNPAIVVFEDSVVPSRSWRPLDKAAQAQLLKLGVKAELASPPAEQPARKEIETMSEANHRIADRSPV